MMPFMLLFATHEMVVHAFMGMLELLKEVVENVLAASGSMLVYTQCLFFPFFSFLPLLTL